MFQKQKPLVFQKKRNHWLWLMIQVMGVCNDWYGMLGQTHAKSVGLDAALL